MIIKIKVKRENGEILPRHLSIHPSIHRCWIHFRLVRFLVIFSDGFKLEPRAGGWVSLAGV